MSEGRSRTLLWILIGGGAFFLFVLAVFTLVYLTLHAGGTDAGITSFGDRIGVVDLDGVILSPQPVVGQLKKFADDSSIKAIIIHVNSPGGGVAASEEIYREVKRIRSEKKKRIVVSIETVGASGAYYVASASDKIYADQGSIVGSIGVIVGQTQRCCHQDRRIQRHRQSDPRSHAQRAGLHAGADR
jgi:protease-4